MSGFFQKVLNNQLVRYVFILLVGIGVGAVFYPTSQVEDKIHKKYKEETVINENIHQQEIKSLKEEVQKTFEQYQSLKLESEKRISSLMVQIQTLQSKQKTSYYKLVKPDGTIEIKRFSESEINESSSTISQIQEEFKNKIESIETKWETIHKQRLEEIKKDFVKKEEIYKSRIEELERSKVIKTNQKKFSVEGGYNTDRQYYIHGTGDLYGPLFMGVHTESDDLLDKKSIGFGLGIRF